MQQEGSSGDNSQQPQQPQQQQQAAAGGAPQIHVPGDAEEGNPMTSAYSSGGGVGVGSSSRASGGERRDSTPSTTQHQQQTSGDASRASSTYESSFNTTPAAITSTTTGDAKNFTFGSTSITAAAAGSGGGGGGGGGGSGGSGSGSDSQGIAGGAAAAQLDSAKFGSSNLLPVALRENSSGPPSPPPHGGVVRSGTMTPHEVSRGIEMMTTPTRGGGTRGGRGGGSSSHPTSPLDGTRSPGFSPDTTGMSEAARKYRERLEVLAQQQQHQRPLSEAEAELVEILSGGTRTPPEGSSPKLGAAGDRGYIMDTSGGPTGGAGNRSSNSFPAGASVSTPTRLRAAASTPMGKNFERLRRGSTASQASVHRANVSKTLSESMTPVAVELQSVKSGGSPATHSVGALSHETHAIAEADVPQLDLKKHSDADEWIDKDFGAACIGAVYAFIFLRTLSSKDLFTDIMRKLMITAGALYSPCSLAFGAYWLSLIWMDPQEPLVAARAIAASCAAAVALLVFIPAYAYIRINQEAPNWLMNYWIAGISVFFLGIGISVPAFPVPTAMYALAEASVLARSDLLLLQLSLAFGIWLVTSYNVSMFLNSVTGWRIAGLDNVHVGTNAENTICMIVGFFILFLMTGALYLQYIEFVKLVDRSAATSLMSKEVASRLREWDMPGIRKVLKDYHELPHAETKIYNEFCGIVTTINDFARFVPKEVVVSMLGKNEDDGGGQQQQKKKSRSVCSMENKVLTLLFMDVANFTAICETMDVEMLVELMSAYFAHATKILMLHGFVIDKFIGDAVFGILGAPGDCENQGVLGISAALHLLGVVRHTLRPLFEEEGFGLDVRIGVHRGPAVVGTIGSKLRVSWTALGDSVNLAARLEGLNKFFRSNIAVSNDLLEAAVLNNEQVFATRRLGQICVKGKAEPKIIHQVLGVIASEYQGPGRRQGMREDSLTSVETAKYDGSSQQQQQQHFGGSSSTEQSNESGGLRSGGGGFLTLQTPGSNTPASLTSDKFGGTTTIDSSEIYTSTRVFSPQAAIVHAGKYFLASTQTMLILEQLNQAQLLYEQGNLAEAKAVYAKLLQDYNFDATHNFSSMFYPTASSAGQSVGDGVLLAAGGATSPSTSSQIPPQPQPQQSGASAATTGTSTTHLAAALWPQLLNDCNVDREMVEEAIQKISRQELKSDEEFDPTQAMLCK